MSETKISKSSPRYDLILESRKKMGMSQEEFIKGLHTFSKGECSMGMMTFRRLESAEKTKKNHINADMLNWIFRFAAIEPNKFFNY